MPIIDIAIPDNALSAKAKQEMPSILGQIALEYEGLAGSKFAESFTWVYIHELPSANVTQVSGPPAKPIYRIIFTTLQTLLDDERKKKLGVDVAKAIYKMEGTEWNEDEAHNRIWIFFDDVHQGDWIVGAKVNNIPDLKNKADQERGISQ